MLCFLLLAAAMPEFWDQGTAPANAIKLHTPGVQYRMNEASATSVPWIDSNGWRFSRDRNGTYYYDVPGAVVPLAMAEAYANQVKALIHSSDHEAFESMLAFLRQIDRPPLAELANIGLIDDGSNLSGE